MATVGRSNVRAGTNGSAHPTRERLLATTVELLTQQLGEHVTADLVLAESGVSRGSMYHHFRDFPDLVDHAYVRIFATHVDDSIAQLTEVLAGARSRDELLAGLARVTALTQSSGLISNRTWRLWVLANASRRPEMHELLAAEQQRLTDALAGLVRRAQDAGWYRRELDPEVVAVFVQAYTLGKVVDDITARPVNPEAWESMIMAIIEQLFIER